MRGPQNRLSWRVPIGAVLVMTLALAGCKGADTQASTGSGSTAVTTPGGDGTATGGTEPGTTAAAAPTTPGETTILPWPKITTTIAPAAGQPAPTTTAAPPATKPPAPAPPTTPKPTGPTSTLKPLTPACGAITVFNLIYFSISAADFKTASDAKKKDAIIALDQTAINVQKAIPDLAAAIKTLHDYQLDRIDGKNPATTGLDEASKKVSDWTKGNGC